MGFATPQRENLWSGNAPGAKGTDARKDIPAITIYTPTTNQTGTAVIICPGGGYHALSMKKEGSDIAQWLNSLGVTAVILEYRMARGGYRHPIPLQDAQRAIRTIRARAKELHIDPSKVGIMGFSAGGHLASTAGTHFDAGDPSAKDPIDRVSCRPDFMVLCYAVIALGEPYTHKGSQNNLLGKNATKDLVESLSNEKQVMPQTPPTFLLSTDEDHVVPSMNSVAFYMALHKAKVPAELHIYRKGGHGVGLAKRYTGTRGWPKACEEWMRGLGLLGKSK